MSDAYVPAEELADAMNVPLEVIQDRNEAAAYLDAAGGE